MEKSGEKLHRVEITVHGRVQGVAFRFYTQSQARQLGVTGWVRNNADGTVRILAEGTRAELETFLAWTGRGPDHARVDRQDTHWSEASGRFQEFNITG
jgi:acylphosphatase